MAIADTQLNKPLPAVDKKEGQRTHQLLSVTALRFFAAALILTKHCGECFEINKPIDPASIGLFHGVTCFFVLSGFILIYVHPVLATKKEVIRFWQARFARLWPGYACSLLLYIAVMPSSLMVPGAIWYMLSYLTLTQSWTLYRPCFTAFNNPAWSMSVEMVFYMSFPFLVRNFKTNWYWKLAASILVALPMVALSAFEHFPDFPAYGASAPIYININPMTRFFEFITGMVFGLLFQQIKDKPFKYKSASLFQVAILAVATFLIFLPRLWTLPPDLRYLEPVRSWIIYCGIAPVYACLILSLALEKGFLDRLLRNRVVVYLGECSYSLFIYHYSIILFFLLHKPIWEHYPMWLVVSAWWAACLAISIASFELIEKPSRKFLLRKFAGA